jgi:hypothetical protein
VQHISDRAHVLAATETVLLMFFCYVIFVMLGNHSTRNMNQKKQQHILPQCYQKSWLAPDCPSDFEPYVWLFKKDGTEKKRKAPKHVFVENEKYTIRLNDGSRDLIVEDTLMRTEDAFMAVLPKIKDRRKLETEDIGRLCVFTAAMHARTNTMGRQFRKFLGDIHELVVKGEHDHNAPPITSLETKDMAQYAHQRMIQATLQVVPQMLFRMSLAILETNERLGFITSDTPCVLFDPDAYRRPPGLRSPNLSNTHIEVSLPLTPEHALVFSHSRVRGYMPAVPQYVDDLNRRVRFGCSEHFISWKGETNPFWFEEGAPPDDAWENTTEGKHAMQRMERHRKAQEAWEKEYRAKVSSSA